MSDRAENLEAIELRMKNDILAEAQKYVFERYLRRFLSFRHS